MFSASRRRHLEMKNPAAQSVTDGRTDGRTDARVMAIPCHDAMNNFASRQTNCCLTSELRILQSIRDITLL